MTGLSTKHASNTECLQWAPHICPCQPTASKLLGVGCRKEERELILEDRELAKDTKKQTPEKVILSSKAAQVNHGE